MKNREKLFLSLLVAGVVISNAGVVQAGKPLKDAKFLTVTNVRKVARVTGEPLPG